MTEDRFITYEAAREIFATKADITEVRTDVAEFRAEVRTDVAELRSEVGTSNAELRAEVRTDVASIRTEMAEMEVRMIKWMVAVQIGGITAIAAVTTAIIAISRLLGD